MHLGIDLGTSNSAVVGLQDGTPRLFKTADGTDVLPSVISIDKRNHRFVGMRAYGRIYTAPDTTAQGFKRLMGTSSPVQFQGPGIVWTPEECSAEILRTLVGQARTEAGDFTLDGTVVTIPAAFNQMQSEATIRAAGMAGIERVTLVQEPVAAAIASVADSSLPNGVFLIYDIGGGTFDVALVQSIKGSVTILSHEGINMLGGRDFDRRIVDAHVRPWLLDNFDIPSDFQIDPRFRRLMGIARHAAEKARIELSTSETGTIHAGDEELRISDTAGDDIYLSIDITRRDVEVLVEDKLAESIALCRKVLRDNGLAPDDVARVVLIGGPSKMPLIRETVPRELGIELQQGLDPMTAVATGAAIFSASRDWSEAGSRGKPTRKREETGGTVAVAFDFPATVGEEMARLYVRPSAETPPGHTVEVTDLDGVSSGKVPLSGGVKLDLRLPRLGPNRFAISVRDATGREVAPACREITIERLGAMPGGIPMTYTLSVKVQQGQVGHETNRLTPLATKGIPLPAEGVTNVRAAHDLRGGEAGYLRIELFQQTGDVADPELALCIGDFRLDGVRHLDPGERIRRGQNLNLHWHVDDNHKLTMTVEVPDLGRVIEARDLYLPEAGHVDYSGKDGAELANTLLAQAEHAVKDASEALGHSATDAIDALKRRLEDQHEALSGSIDAETHRAVAEEARRIRQDVASLRHRPENRARALLADIAEVAVAFDRLRPNAEAIECDRFDRLSGTAQRALRTEDFEAAERALTEMDRLRYDVLFRDPQFLADLAGKLALERHAAVDRDLHDRLVAEATRAFQQHDIAALRAVISQFFQNRISTGTGQVGIGKLADLLGT